MIDYKKISELLEKNLAKSAFRRGTSAFRLGLIQQGSSDHIPIEIRIKGIAQPDTTIISWNLLADAHLYNNFMNISGTRHLLSAMEVDNIYGGHEKNNKLYHYFSELGQFIYDNRKNDNLVILDKNLLNQFNSVQSHSSLLTRSRDPNTTRDKSAHVERSRAAIAAILLDETQDDAHEFKLAIQHCVDLIYHIKHKDGVLKWSNRYQQLLSNPELCNQLYDADFLCLQECTNPDDIAQLLPEKRSIVHRVNASTTDHCAIFYDVNKFQIVGMPVLDALDGGKKPCIMARFENKMDGSQMIVGSIHHPGGRENSIHEIIEMMTRLKRAPDEPISFYLPGDYNHTEDFFKSSDHTEYGLFYPELGTMAGSDYGNTNKSIDAVLTNAYARQIHVERVHSVSISPPAEMCLRVHFKEGNTYRSSASSSLSPPVQGVVTPDEGIKAIEILGQNDATYAQRMTL